MMTEAAPFAFHSVKIGRRPVRTSAIRNLAEVDGEKEIIWVSTKQK
jgi:hypothetical protein